MNKISYSLTESVLEGADINAAIKVLKSKKITMGSKTIHMVWHTNYFKF